MSKFTEKLVVSLQDGDRWRLEKEFEYYTDITGERKYIHVPEGFETDFASIPKVFLPFLRYRDKFNKASVIHDYLYRSKMFDRKTSDRIFLEGMKVLGIGKRRYLFYWAVRLFGWLYWRRYV